MYFFSLATVLRNSPSLKCLIHTIQKSFNTTIALFVTLKMSVLAYTYLSVALVTLFIHP